MRRPTREPQAAARRVWPSIQLAARIASRRAGGVGPVCPVTVGSGRFNIPGGYLAVGAASGYKRFEHDALGQLLAVIPEEARERASRPAAPCRRALPATMLPKPAASTRRARALREGGRLETKAPPAGDELGWLIEKKARGAAGDDHVTRYAGRRANAQQHRGPDANDCAGVHTTRLREDEGRPCGRRAERVRRSRARRASAGTR